MKFIIKILIAILITGGVGTAAYILAPTDTKKAIQSKVYEVTNKNNITSMMSMFDDRSYKELSVKNSAVAEAIKDSGKSLWSEILSAGNYMADGKITESESRELSAKLINRVLAQNPELNVEKVDIPDLNAVLANTFLSSN